MKRLTVYNHFGLGDVFESRGFVLDWMRAYGVETCEYETRFPAVFEDLPQIITKPVAAHRELRHSVSKRAGHILLNSWIGALNGETIPRGDYVIHPGVGCCVHNLFRMHRDYQRRVGITNGMQKPVVEYLSNINYSRIHPDQMARVFAFMNVWKGYRVILFCNGPTGSQHAENFSMTRMVELIPDLQKYVLIFTEREPCALTNAFFSDDLTKRQPGESDFNAISYLSRFCDVIVGRCSGAQMVCETKENWMDESKTLLSFTQHNNGASFVLDPLPLGLKMRRVWSGASTPEEAAEVLKTVL